MLPWSAAFVFAAGNVFAAAADTHALNVASDSADRALRKLAEQAGVEVVFSTDFAARVKTNAVQGDFAPIDAAHQMLAGTPLQAMQKTAGGAIVVSRRPAVSPAAVACRSIRSTSMPSRSAAVPTRASSASAARRVR